MSYYILISLIHWILVMNGTMWLNCFPLNFSYLIHTEMSVASNRRTMLEYAHINLKHALFFIQTIRDITQEKYRYKELNLSAC